ncbi:hypothetical protein ACOZ4N_00630 (plasmid) [Halorientalis pallida]|uniref:hypothetical protein n=1 Tax=Halorientalis pallida TaxID=2479928 RepID=UPI003C6FCA23
MATSDDHLIQEPNVDVTRDGDLVSFELRGTKYEMGSSEDEKIGTKFLAIGRQGEDRESLLQ